MRPKMKAENTIASVRAKPSHWIDVISSRISGWRVTDSMTLPKMKPTPPPGPIVPRPAPMPRAIALPALRPYSCAVAESAAWAMWVTSERTERSTVLSPCLVLGGHSAAEVDRGKGGEDEGLQRRDQRDLEDEERNGHRARDQAEDDRPEDRQVQQDDQSAAHEEDQQVAGQDV